MRAVQGLPNTDDIVLSRVSYLVVDRVTFSRKLLVQGLRNFSAVDVREAANLDTALDIIRTRPPGVLFLGIGQEHSPEIAFLETVHRHACSERGAARIPTIIIGENACTDDILQVHGLGADSYIAAPYSVATIEAHLLKVLRQYYQSFHPGH